MDDSRSAPLVQSEPAIVSCLSDAVGLALLNNAPVLVKLRLGSRFMSFWVDQDGDVELCQGATKTPPLLIGGVN